MKVPDLSGNLYNFKQFGLLQVHPPNQDLKNEPRNHTKRIRQVQKRLGNQTKLGICQLLQGTTWWIQLDAWFNEKYNPELLDLQEKERKDLSKKNYE